MDYKAVGVEMIIPIVEIQNGKRLQGNQKAIDVTSPSRTAQRHYRSQYQNSNKNYTFSPRFDCQQNGLAASGFINGKPIGDKVIAGKEDIGKRTN